MKFISREVLSYLYEAGILCCLGCRFKLSLEYAEQVVHPCGIYSILSEYFTHTWMRIRE